MPHVAQGDRSDRGAFLVTAVLLTIALVAISFAYFMESRTMHHHYMQLRADAHARYASEYVVARYGLPRFLRINQGATHFNPDGSEISPTWNPEFIQNTHQWEDKGLHYTYSYEKLRWDPHYDTRVGKAHYFINAVGKVSWKDGRGVHEASHRSAIGITIDDYSKFLYFSNRELSPENNPVRFWGPDHLYGRVHINGQAQVVPGNYPTFHGFFTQTAENVINLPEAAYEQVFPGGFSFPYPEYDWPPEDAIQQVKNAHTLHHTYADSAWVGGYEQMAPVTTSIVFDQSQYHVSQYVPPFYKAGYLDGISNPQELAEATFLGDTLYVPQENGAMHVTKTLPQIPGHQLIWVKGVARVSGAVRGQVTLLASDTLFIMDNVYTVDTDLESFGNPEEFGMVPLGSPNRIGLASEGNIVIAATPMNGAYNGQDCGYPNTSNINGGGQEHSDIVITAALMAEHCSFGAEFWKTSVADNWVQGASGQNQLQPSECDTELHDNLNNQWNYSMNRAPEAGGPPQPYRCNTGTTDNRGEIWFCGSMVQAVRGFVRRSPIGPWGNAAIGYDEKHYRYDSNFFSAGPPVWFKARFTGGTADITTAMVQPDYERWLDLRETFRVDG